MLIELEEDDFWNALLRTAINIYYLYYALLKIISVR